MTGIQALERIAPNLALAPGKPLAREFEYKRHGTQTLIAALRVAMGSVYAHCGETRTEEDFYRFIATLIEHHPGYRVYRFVADQLNTQQSEVLVRLAAGLSGLESATWSADQVRTLDPGFQRRSVCNAGPSRSPSIGRS